MPGATGMRPDLELYSYAQLARAWHVSERTVRRWLDTAGVRRIYRRVGRTSARRVAWVRGTRRGLGACEKWTTYAR